MALELLAYTRPLPTYSVSARQVVASRRVVMVGVEGVEWRLAWSRHQCRSWW